MKKVLIASGVAVLAFAMIASAAGYTFNSNLTVGSTGADVVALQSFLIANGYGIPAITSGAAAKGYFGSQTKAAVMAYQASVGVPNTGFVGPLTRAKLNGGAVNVSTTCPVGYTCTANTVAFSCPVGYTCTANNGTGTVVGNTTGINTPNVAGSLTISNGSAVGNGTTVNDGQTVDVASFKLTAGASDMAVTSASIDFSVRPWLYMTSMTIRDQVTGAVVATIPVTANSFTEITVGSDYRLTIPLSNIVVLHGSNKTVILSAQFGASNRIEQKIYVSRVEVRAVDGTGVSTTETLGDGSLPTGLGLYVYYQGSSSSSIIVTLDSSSPLAQIRQTSTSAVTNSIPLAVYSFKSQSIASTLQSLILNVSTVSTTSTNVDPNTVFQNIQLMSGSTVLANGTMSVATGGTVTVTFSNFNLTLPQDQYVPVGIVASVQKNVNGVLASTTLTATSTNIGGIDANSNNLTINSSGSLISGAIATFSTAGASIGSESLTVAQPGSNTSGTFNSTSFNGSFTLTAGANPIYISRTADTALHVALSNTASTSATFSNLTAGGGVQSNDPANFYQVIPGASRTFSFNGTFANTESGTRTSVTLGIDKVYFTDNTSAAQEQSITTGLDGLNAYFAGQFVTLGSQTQ